MSPANRPKAPGAPATAALIFGARLPLAERLASWLTGAGIVRGLLGPREAEQIWERHLLNGVGIAALIDPDSLVIDIGSGAGLPGLPLLLARPDLQMVLVEPKARRADFLTEVCDDLGLPARVLRARATPEGLVPLPDGESNEPVPPADVVTARAVASIAHLARWAAPLLRPGGRLLAVKGASAEAELERDRGELQYLGFKDAQIIHTDSPGLAPDVHSSAPGTSASPLAATVVAMTLGSVSRGTSADARRR